MWQALNDRHVGMFIYIFDLDQYQTEVKLIAQILFEVDPPGESLINYI